MLRDWHTFDKRNGGADDGTRWAKRKTEREGEQANTRVLRCDKRPPDVDGAYVPLHCATAQLRKQRRPGTKTTGADGGEEGEQVESSTMSPVFEQQQQQQHQQWHLSVH